MGPSEFEVLAAGHADACNRIVAGTGYTLTGGDWRRLDEIEQLAEAARASGDERQCRGHLRHYRETLAAMCRRGGTLRPSLHGNRVGHRRQPAFGSPV